MLKALREGSKSIVLKLILFGFLLLAMAGLALMDVQGMFRNGIKPSTIAKIDGEKLSVMEFDQILRAEMQRRNIRREEALQQDLPRQVLAQEISQRLFAKAAADMNLIIDDATVAREIKAMIQPLVKQGMNEKDALQRVLYTFGMSEAQLVASFKTQAATDYLVRAVAGGVTAPKSLLQDMIKLNYEVREGEYIELTAGDAKKIKNPSDEELKDYYKIVADQFMQPEKRSFSVAVLDKKSMQSETEITKEDVLAYYDEHKDEYGSQEQRMVSQIVVKDADAAKAVYAEASKSKDLKEAAQNAKDKGARYIKASSYSKDDIAAELADAAFSGGADQVLEPVQSPLGWHILYIEKITPAAVTSFDAARAEIEKKLADEKAAEALYNRANEIDDQIAGGRSLSEIAKEYGLKEETYKNITRGQKLSLPEKVVESAFTLNQSEAGQLIETADGSFMVAEVSEITPAAQEPLENVKDKVEALWQEKQKVLSLYGLAQNIQKRAEDGEAFEKIADDLDLDVKKTGPIKRALANDATAQKHDLAEVLFALTKQGAVSVAAQGDTVTVLRYISRQFDVPKNTKKEELDLVEAKLNHALQNEVLEQYRQSLMAKYNVKINNDILEEMYRPKDSEAE